MERGDLIEIDGKPFLVCLDDGGPSVQVVSDTAVASVLPRDTPCKILANPTQDWPYIVLPFRPKLGPLLRVGRPHLDGYITPFENLREWVLGEPLRQGGALYLHPSLNLKYPERVALQYQHRWVSVVVPRLFVPLGRKAAIRKFASLQSPRSDATVYDHLLDGNIQDDDET